MCFSLVTKIILNDATLGRPPMACSTFMLPEVFCVFVDSLLLASTGLLFQKTCVGGEKSAHIINTRLPPRPFPRLLPRPLPRLLPLNTVGLE